MSLPGVDYQGDEIAIIGMAGRFPGAPDVPAFWRNLLAGVDSIRDYTVAELRAAGVAEALLTDPRYVRASGHLDGIDRFDADFFGYGPGEAARLDPQQRLFLETAWSTVEDAGYDVTSYPGTIGVFAGASINRYLLFHLLPAGHALLPDGQLEPGHTPDYLTTRVSYKLGLTGPSVAVQTACSSSLVAVCLAAQALQDIRCDLAIAGGVAISSTTPAGYLAGEEGLLSPDGRCRAFDAAAAGAAPGSGVGAVLLKRLADALGDGDHVYAVLRGWAVNNDGAARAGFTAPGPDGQAAVVAEALSAGDIDPASVGLVETSAGGTAVGDAIEVEALARAFAAAGDWPGTGPGCALGSVKTNVGNLDAASGIAGLIKAALAVRDGTIPASLHVARLNPELDLAGPFRVVTRTVPWPAAAVRRAGVTSLGLGGTNAHVIVEQPPARAALPPAGGPWVLPLSGRTPAAVRAAATRLAAFLAEYPEVALADVAYTLGTGRAGFDHRLAVVAGTVAEACARLAATDPGGTTRGTPGPGTVGGTSTSTSTSPAGVSAELARRWMRGDPVDWSVHGPPGRRIPLPGYPFHSSPYWVKFEYA